MVKGIVNPSATTYYPGRHYNLEVTAAGEKVQKFYFAGGATIAVRTVVGEEGTLQWILSDHLNSASVTASEDGTYNSRIQYTAFGEVRTSSGLTATKYRYTGQLAQDVLGLDFYVSRWMDPMTGHFISADSLIPNIGNPMSFDHFAYALNNPIVFNDPSGHDAGCHGDECGSDEPIKPNWKEFWNYMVPNVIYSINAIGMKTLRSVAMTISSGVSKTQNNNKGFYSQNYDVKVPFWGQIANSLLQYPKANLTGPALDTIKNDSIMDYIDRAIVAKTQDDPRFNKESFTYDYNDKPEGKKDKYNNMVHFGGDDRINAFFQPGTWEVRNATYSAKVRVTNLGSITISYHIEDEFDLLPQAGRDAYYNYIAAYIAPIYHDLLGGNPNMVTIADWQSSY
ncbi:MAG: RHS repeat-associated core domain-containing protein [Anaerolineaceae bacterium]